MGLDKQVRRARRLGVAKQAAELLSAYLDGLEYFEDDADRATATYESFHEGRAEAVRVLIPLPPAAMWSLGPLIEVTYEAERDEGEIVHWMHRFDSPPQLAYDDTRAQLWIVGGDYEVTQRGITG